MVESAEELTVERLNELFTKSESANKELFAEMRTNVLMVAGKHYQATRRKLQERVRHSNLDDSTKIRLVKNHINKIARTYSSEILSVAPGVRCIPHAESEIQDQKAAELANAVWQDAKHRYRLREKLQSWTENFIDLGECAAKIFWDQNKGSVVAHEQEVDENGDFLFIDPLGQMTIEQASIDPVTGQIIHHEQVASKRPVMSGAFVFETILPFNLLHDPAAETIEDSRYLIVRKMMAIEDAKKLAGDDPQKVKFITETAETTFKVFDAQKADLVDLKGQVLVKEIFYRPCKQYPNGWYCLFTEFGKLHESELPYGIFPIVWAGFQKIPTTARAHSIIRHLRPIQANINQLSSQAVQHQLTVGDDKVFVRGGGKVEEGASRPGVRWFKATGDISTIQGRAGDQFFAPITQAIEELYDIANLADIKNDISGQLDPNVLLFRSARHKKKFISYAETMEAFQRDVCSLYLRLSQKYMPDDMLIKAVGRREHINIAEFKEVKELDYAIKLDEVSDDVETTLGKSLQIQQILQYVGKDLPPETIAQFISQMPYVDKEGTSELMAKVKAGDNLILRMDRGIQVPTKRGQDHAYFIKRIDSRMSMSDFDILPPQSQQLYEMKRVELEQMIAKEAEELKRMQSEFIPTGGALIGVDVYTQVPNSEGGQKTVRARVPYEAVQWLLKQLESQGQSQADLEQLNPSQQAGIANQFMNQPGMSAQSGLNGPSQQMSTLGQGVM